MYVDDQTRICSAQAFTADAVSENTYDAGVAGRDISIGEPMGIGISVSVAAKVSDGNETYEFQAVQDSDAALGSPTVLGLRAIDKANLTAGSFHILPIPPGSVTERYLGLNFNGGGTNPSITVDAWIAPLSMLAVKKDYADGFTVS